MRELTQISKTNKKKNIDEMFSLGDFGCLGGGHISHNQAEEKKIGVFIKREKKLM